MDLRRISDPLTREQKLAVLPIAKVKAQERVAHDAEDELIGDHIEAAFDHLHGPDGWLNGYCLLEEEFEFFPPALLGTTELPLRPVGDEKAVAVSRRLAMGDYTAYGAGDVLAVSSNGICAVARLRAEGFADQAGVIDPRQYRITFKAGWSSPDLVPRPLVQAMLLLAGHFYQNREATLSDTRVSNVSKKVEFGLVALAGRYRISPDHS
ncbi:hypothetical protein ABEV34_04965 [Methylorubrum rhodesianum]|uniref:hypothetical protein n=1 Tax=Methylorubrum rhodesianum TaxID=29427 RepID=UPI003D2DF299